MTLQILIWSVNVKLGAFLTLDAPLFSALQGQPGTIPPIVYFLVFFDIFPFFKRPERLRRVYRQHPPCTFRPCRKYYEKTRDMILGVLT